MTSQPHFQHLTLTSTISFFRLFSNTLCNQHALQSLLLQTTFVSPRVSVIEFQKCPKCIAKVRLPNVVEKEVKKWKAVESKYVQVQQITR